MAKKVEKNEVTEVTEKFELPSRGFYEGVEIPSHINLRPMKMSEERLIFSAGKNKSFNELMTEILNNCIQEDFDSADLYEGDRTYLLFMLRSISYTSEYHLSMSCPSCGKLHEAKINLEELPVKYLESLEDAYKEVTLPMSKRSVTVKNLTGKETSALISRVKNSKNTDEYLESMVMKIKEIEGEDHSIPVYRKFIENLIGRDSAMLRNAIEKVQFGIISQVEDECPNCGSLNKFGLEVTDEFFRPRYE